MTTREATVEDAEATARVFAAVAEEGLLATEPPVDVAARAERFRAARPGNARAISLYASAGFEVEGLRRDHYRRRDGSLRSALLMARLLGPPGR